MYSTEQLRYMLAVQEHAEKGGEVEWSFRGESHPGWNKVKTYPVDFYWEMYDYRIARKPREVWLWEHEDGMLYRFAYNSRRLCYERHQRPDTLRSRGIKFVEVIDD